MTMKGRYKIMAGLRGATTGTVRREDAHRGMHHLVATLAAAILLVGSNDLHAQGRVFYDNFEANQTNQWSYEYSKCTTATTAADGGSPRSGTFMAKCNWNGVAAWNSNDNRSSLLLPSWRYTNEFFLRVWVRHDANVDNVDGSKLLRMSGAYPEHSMYLAARPGPEMFAYWEGVGDGVRGPLTYNGGMWDRRWHKIEIYHKNNTIGKTDGILRLWNDGVLRIDYRGKTRSSKGIPWDSLTLMSNWSSNPGWEHDALNNVYWDDIEIYSDLGTGATGSMASATISASPQLSLPAPPTNARVIRSPDPQ